MKITYKKKSVIKRPSTAAGEMSFRGAPKKIAIRKRVMPEKDSHFGGIISGSHYVIGYYGELFEKDHMTCIEFHLIGEGKLKFASRPSKGISMRDIYGRDLDLIEKECYDLAFKLYGLKRIYFAGIITNSEFSEDIREQLKSFRKGIK
jgi:hypothetical protein